MGGTVFSETLWTPRMPPGIYEQVRNSTQSTLRTQFIRVESPIEAPGKDTFGDVDILTFGPLSPSYDSSLTPLTKVTDNIAALLKATKWMKNNHSINLAIRWPGQEAGDVEKYIQLDVQVCASEKVMQWELFHAAHGDLWSILGTLIRPFGLTVNDKGMHLRIPDIEKHDRKKAMVFLTDDPNRILLFIGLETKKWFGRFASQDEMFEYASGCRLFWVKPLKSKDETEGDVIGAEREIEGHEGVDKGQKKLKHNDRQRMVKRPIFRAWIENFLPKCREEGRLGNSVVTREEIHAEAFEVFGVKEEYDVRLKQWRLSKHNDELKQVIKGGVPEGEDPPFRSASIRLMKSVIIEGEKFEGVVPKAAEKDENGFYDLHEVKKFVAENWQSAAKVGLVRQQAKALENMKFKAQKELEAGSKRKLDEGPAGSEKDNV